MEFTITVQQLYHDDKFHRLVGKFGICDYGDIDENDDHIIISNGIKYHLLTIATSGFGDDLCIWFHDEQDDLSIEKREHSILFISSEDCVIRIANSFQEYLQIIVSLKYVDFMVCIEKTNPKEYVKILNRELKQAKKSYAKKDVDVINIFNKCRKIANHLNIPQRSSKWALSKLREAGSEGPEFELFETHIEKNNT